MIAFITTAQVVLGGIIGSILGVAATVWATRKTIAASADEFERRRRVEQEDEGRMKIDALKVEIDFNIGLREIASNKKIPVFSQTAWEDAGGYLKSLDGATVTVLRKAYAWALFHNSAARLERPGVENFGTFIERAFDQAIELFAEARENLS